MIEFFPEFEKGEGSGGVKSGSLKFGAVIFVAAKHEGNGIGTNCEIGFGAAKSNDLSLVGANSDGVNICGRSGAADAIDMDLA